MKKVLVRFSRDATVRETGEAVLEVDNPLNWDEVVEKARRQEFSQFLITNREYDDETWEFDQPDEEERNVS